MDKEVRLVGGGGGEDQPQVAVGAHTPITTVVNTNKIATAARLQKPWSQVIDQGEVQTKLLTGWVVALGQGVWFYDPQWPEFPPCFPDTVTTFGLLFLINRSKFS